MPSRKHDEFQVLSASTQRVINVLAALLRIADGLDRSQFSVVQNVDVKLGKSVVITVQASGDAELEMWAARGRSDLFEKVFKRPVQFVTKNQEERGLILSRSRTSFFSVVRIRSFYRLPAHTLM